MVAKILAEEHVELLLRISREWAEAEYCIKYAESVSGELSLPPIVELRYAGRRIVHSLGQMFEIDNHDAALLVDLRDALGNVVRAKYDAIDSLINLASSSVSEAHANYSSDELESRIPRYREYLDLLQEAVQNISSSRARLDTRRDIYQRFSPDRLGELQGLIIAFATYASKRDSLHRAGAAAKNGPWASRIFRGVRGSAQAAVAVYAGIISAIAGLLLALLRLL